MNALPVDVDRLKDKQARTKYFEDMARWGFDVAYTAFYARTVEDVLGKDRKAYAAFAQEAHERGLPACVQIQSTLCNPRALGVEEAQYHVDNAPDTLDDGRFFASFASEKWKAYLQELTRVFIEDFGYDWIVFEEPMYRVDIPGSKDCFHALFVEQYPELEYPTARAETVEYLTVQKLKADVLIRFYEALTSHAKSLNASKVGIMPWFFIPTTENTPEGTLNTSCDIGRLAALDSLDFLVVRMQPDNIFVDVMRTGDEMRRSPLLYYPEVMAHALGKPLMAVSNPVDEHTNYPEYPLIPLDFFQKSLLASLAAAPDGMTRHWYGARYDEDAAHMEFMTPINKHVSRLGNLTTPVGFMFSYRGGRHAGPYTYETAWQSYWAIAKHLMLNEKLPMRTIYADSLAKNLERAPDLQVLVIDEKLPISIGQAQILRQWWQSGRGRALIMFGGGLGYSADEETPGLQPISHPFGGLLQVMGVRERPEAQVILPESKSHLKYVARIARSAFLADGTEAPVDRIANVERIFGSRSNEVYIDEATGSPVIIQYSVGETLAFFCGLELTEATAPIAAKIIKHALNRADAPTPSVESSVPELLWNSTRTGFTVVVNAGDKPAKCAVARPNSALWDVVNRGILPGESKAAELTMDPLSFRIFRHIGKRSKFYDMIGAVYIHSIVDGAGRADVSAYTLSSVSFLLKVAPKDVIVDGRPVKFDCSESSGAFQITLNGLSTDDHLISIRWQ